MPIVFSDHAKEQLRKRRISQKLAKDVISNPQEILISFRRRKLRRALISAKILQIVTITEGSRITVISGYYVRKKTI